MVISCGHQCFINAYRYYTYNFSLFIPNFYDIFSCNFRHFFLSRNIYAYYLLTFHLLRFISHVPYAMCVHCLHKWRSNLKRHKWVSTNGKSISLLSAINHFHLIFFSWKILQITFSLPFYSTHMQLQVYWQHTPAHTYILIVLISRMLLFALCNFV